MSRAYDIAPEDRQGDGPTFREMWEDLMKDEDQSITEKYLQHLLPDNIEEHLRFDLLYFMFVSL